MLVILKSPVISEKSMKLASTGYYTFLVNPKARKPVIRKAIEDEFGVNVISIKTANFKGEEKLQRNKRGYTTTSGFKKATVQLKNGQKISLFETQVEEKPQAKEEVKEKKSLLKGTKVKIERADKPVKAEEKK